MDRKEVIEIIKLAFENVNAPKEITLHVAEAHDRYDYNHNEEHRKNDYTGPWENIPIKDIKSCQHALSYVEKDGMRYYLPAYMVWYLNNFGNDDEIWSDHTLYSLDNNPNDKELAEYHRERFSLFNNEQLRACALFVKYCANDTTEFTDTDFAKK